MQVQNVQMETALAAVSASGCLGNSARQYDLLKYLLTEENEGRGDRIKAYSIALDVFGRNEDFDNSLDSIVRVEMHRLRKKLKEFNASPAEFTLTIPKASYRIQAVRKHNETIPTPEDKKNQHTQSQAGQDKSPKFKRYTLAVLVTSLIAIFGAWGFFTLKYGPLHGHDNVEFCSSDIPNLILQPTQLMGSPTGRLGEEAAHMVDDYLQTSLTQYFMVNLITPTTDCQNTGTPLYALEAKIFSSAEHPYISIITRHIADDNIILSENITLPDHSNNLGAQASWDIYKLAAKLANTNGALLNEATFHSWKQPNNKSDYECLNLSLKFYVLFTDTDYQNALSCTQERVHAGGASPEFYAFLANFYIEQARGNQASSLADPFAEAEKLLTIVNKTHPQNSEVLAANLRFHATHPEPNIEELKHIVILLERQSPYNSNMLLLASQVLGAKVGDWERAQEFAASTLRLDNSKAFNLYFMDSTYAFLFSPADEAFEIALKVYHPKSKIAGIANLAAANRAGKTAHAEKCKADLRALGLNSPDDYIEFVRQSHYEPALSAKLIKWLSVP